MSPVTPIVRPAAAVWFARLGRAQEHLPALIDRFHSLRDGPQTRLSHWFEQRYENIYIDRRLLPEFAPVATEVRACAESVLDRGDLKFGFWFNEMGPGEGTTRHDHHEDDELLSAVLYLSVPEGSGELVLYDSPAVIRVTPEVGLLVMFPPHLEHEVNINTGASARLSIAFNFGPAEPD